MDIVLYFLIFLFGSAIGSFLGVIIDRLPRGEGFLTGRSHCDYCKKPLGVIDLIPVFSFFILRGKCRFCHKKLSLYYPVLEIITGLLFLLVFLSTGILAGAASTGILIQTTFYLFIISLLVIIFFTDLKYGIIPFPIVLLATLATFFFLIFNINFLLLNNFLAGVGAFVFFLCLFLITKGRGMGFGDVVYAFFMGFLLGLPKIVLGLYIAFLSGAIISLILVWMKRKKIKGSTVPFGPFLVAGTIISLFWGDQLISLTINALQFTIK